MSSFVFKWWDVRPRGLPVNDGQAAVPQSLYRRVLGERFDALPDVLRNFHDSPTGGKARGTFNVERARGRIRNAVASLMGFPKAGTDVPVHLEVIVEQDRERWVRHIGPGRLETLQWARGNLLIEALGPSTFSSELFVEGPCLRYEFRRSWLAGIPIPRRLGPNINGFVHAGNGGWRVMVRIEAPFLGELVRYEGWIEPE